MTVKFKAVHPQLSQNDALLEPLPRANAIIHLAVKGELSRQYGTRCRQF